MMEQFSETATRHVSAGHPDMPVLYEYGEHTPEGLTEAEMLDIALVEQAFGDDFLKGVDALAASTDDDAWASIQGSVYTSVRELVGATNRKRIENPIETFVGLSYLVDKLGDLERKSPPSRLLQLSVRQIAIATDKMLGDPDQAQDDDTSLQLLAALFESVKQGQDSSGGKAKVIETVEKHYAELLIMDGADGEAALPDSLKELWEDPYFLDLMGKRLADVIELKFQAESRTGKQRDFTDFEKQLSSKLFESYGFGQYERRDIYRSWFARTTPDLTSHGVSPKLGYEVETLAIPRIMRKHLKAMAELARSSIDAPKRLYDEYGIRGFGNYKNQTLVNQLDQQSADSVVVSATEDWNGAFTNRPVEYQVRGAQLSSAIYTEAKSGSQLLDLLERLSDKFGPIKSVVLLAHGAPESIHLGSSTADRRKFKITRDLVETAAPSLKGMVQRGVLGPDASIILYSCDTGAPDGIAEVIAQSTGVFTIAPDHKPRDITKDLFGRVVFTRKEGSRAGAVHARPSPSDPDKKVEREQVEVQL